MSDPSQTPDQTAQTLLGERLKQFNEFQSQNRLRTDAAVKLIVVISGGLLTLSVGAVLGKHDAIPPSMVTTLQYAWAFLFCSICGSVLVMVIMLIAAFHMGNIWLKTLSLGAEPARIYSIKTWTAVRALNAILFLSSATSCVVGIAFMAMVANAVAQGVASEPAAKISAGVVVAPTDSATGLAPLWSTWNLLLGLLAGLLIAEWRERQGRQRHKKQHFEALAAEIRMCGAIAKGFLQGGVPSPAYRMPTIAFDNSLPSILTFKQVAPEDRDALIRYYNNVMSFNRCLDYCHDAMIDKRKGIDEKRLDGQVDRAALKASKISEENGSQYKDAISVLAKHVPSESLGPMKFDNPEDGHG